jgi:hypothetical protein
VLLMGLEWCWSEPFHKPPLDLTISPVIWYNTLMLIADFLSWWYSRGWAWIAKQFFVVYTGKVAEFFSIAELSKTLFAPFRQDASGTKGAPLSVKLQVLGGNIISRIFGFIIRLSLIAVGSVALVICLILGAAASLAWPLLPASIIILPSAMKWIG